ncbi:disease resistance protein RPS4B-like [Mangifera indica]|uniref:disease resistance protein RPS4B-like n=1 Tax=Mangifera indica TaxID=29780 RepID=UPI001CF9E884|nr:disease resistance protein RPS4B-like [Mangifera indica]
MHKPEKEIHSSSRLTFSLYLFFGYASSRWCLKELDEIVKCKNTYDQIIIPVFYDVDPSDVRNQTGDFGKAFSELEKRFMDVAEIEDCFENLRFLKFYGSEHEKKVSESDSSALRHNLICLKRKNCNDGKKLHGFKKLKFDFYEIRYFCFHGYPAKSLLPNFNPKNLVALYMSNSKVKKLWTGNQLQGCKSFDNLPISFNCQSLRKVNLSSCSNLKTISYLLETIAELYLDGTAIEELLPIEHLFRLEKLSLRKCSRLERLPESIRELKSLKCFYLSGCSKLDRLPNDMGNLQTLEVLELEEISFAEVPTFMTSLINLETLSLTRCKMKKRLGIPLVDLFIFQKLIKLKLVDCCIEVLPNNIGQLLSLNYLCLDQNNLETLPESIKDLSNLRGLSLSICQRLKYLPELPSSLQIMIAMNCESLESISSLPAIFLRMESFIGEINFFNCLKLKLEMTDALLTIERSAANYLYHQFYHGKFPEGWVNDNLTSLALCAVASLQDYQQLRIFRVGFHLIVDGEIIFSRNLINSLSFGLEFLKGEDVIESDHVFIRYNYFMKSVGFPTINLNSQGGVAFFVEYETKNGKV